LNRLRPNLAFGSYQAVVVGIDARQRPHIPFSTSPNSTVVRCQNRRPCGCPRGLSVSGPSGAERYEECKCNEGPSHRTPCECAVAL
jgi:hypothetical protein